MEKVGQPPENEMTAAGSSTMAYDGDGLRVKSNAKLRWRMPGAGMYITTTDTSGGTVKDMIYLAGQQVAQRVVSGSAVSYYMSDQVGSVHLMVDASATTCWDADYYPFGGSNIFTGGNCQPQYRYTLMETEPSMSSDVDYAMFRYYSHRFARFMSPDPVGGNPSNPQSWNRYAYVVNNPLRFVDPLGLTCNVPNADGEFAPDYQIPESDCSGDGKIWVPDETVTATFDGSSGEDASVGGADGPGIEPGGQSGPTTSGGGRSGGGAANKNNWKKTGMCLLKGAAVGAGGTLVVGGLAVGAVALGAPAAVVTGGLLVIGAIGGASTLYSAGTNISNGNYAGAAYDVGSLAGGAAAGGAIGGAVGDSINPPATRGWSLGQDWGNRFTPSKGWNPIPWLATGPDAASAGGSTAVGGSGLARFLRGGC